MLSVWWLMAQGAGLGVSVAVAPGPLQAYVLAQTWRHGPRHTLPLVLAPIVSDIPIITAVLLALAWLPAWALRGLEAAGGLLVIYLAWELYRTLGRPAPGASPTQPEPGHTFFKAVLLNALSPGPYIFWSTIAGPLFWHAWAEAPWSAYLFLGAFGLGLVAGLAGYIGLSGSARQVNPRYQPLINLALLLALVGFGLYQLYHGLSGALPRP